MTPFFLFFGLGFAEILTLLVVGILLFGRRLPEVGRQLGKTFVDMKSQLNEVQSELREVDRMANERIKEKARPQPSDSVARGEVIDVDDAPLKAEDDDSHSGDTKTGWEDDRRPSGD